jgi:hypothetical protein
VTVTFDGGGAVCFGFSPRAAALAAFDVATSGFVSSWTAFWTSVDEAVQVLLHWTFWIRSWKT